MMLIQINKNIYSNLTFVIKLLNNNFDVKNFLQFKPLTVIYFKYFEYEIFKNKMKQPQQFFYSMVYFLQQQLGYIMVKNHLLYNWLKLVMMFIWETIVEIDIRRSISNLTKKRMEIYFMITVSLNQVNMIYLRRYKLCQTNPELSPSVLLLILKEPPKYFML